MKLTMNTKLKMIREYLDEQVPMTKLVKKYDYDLAKLEYLVKLYQWQLKTAENLTLACEGAPFYNELSFISYRHL
jgi:hypothetical protein